MLIPRHIVSHEWIRHVFQAFDAKINEDVEALPDAISDLMHNPPTDILKLKNWIREVCKICEVKPSQLSQVAGLSASTVNRFLKKDNVSASLNAKTISMLVRAGEDLVRKRIDEKPWLSDDMAGEMRQRNSYDYYNLLQNNLIAVPVMGDLGINFTWMLDTFQGLISEQHKIIVPAPNKYADKYLFGFGLWDARTEGDPKQVEEINETIICIPTWFEDVILLGNERVIIIERPHDETVSVGIRDLNKDARGNIWLMPLENEIDIVEPVFLGRETVPLIKGKLGIALVVVGTYRILA